MEIFTSTLQQYLVPLAEIEQAAADIRADGYGFLRLPPDEGRPWRKIESALPGVEVSTLQVGGDVEAIGRTLVELDLRRRHGVTLLALSRRGDLLPNPAGETCFEEGDVVVLLGQSEDVMRARTLFAPCAGGADVC